MTERDIIAPFRDVEAKIAANDKVLAELMAQAANLSAMTDDELVAYFRRVCALESLCASVRREFAVLTSTRGAAIH